MYFFFTDYVCTFYLNKDPLGAVSPQDLLVNLVVYYLFMHEGIPPPILRGQESSRCRYRFTGKKINNK